jgi:hypothetical protein
MESHSPKFQDWYVLNSRTRARTLNEYSWYPVCKVVVVVVVAVVITYMFRLEVSLQTMLPV